MFSDQTDINIYPIAYLLFAAEVKEHPDDEVSLVQDESRNPFWGIWLTQRDKNIELRADSFPYSCINKFSVVPGKDNEHKTSPNIMGTSDTHWKAYQEYIVRESLANEETGNLFWPQYLFSRVAAFRSRGVESFYWQKVDIHTGEETVFLVDSPWLPIESEFNEKTSFASTEEFYASLITAVQNQKMDSSNMWLQPYLGKMFVQDMVLYLKESLTKTKI